MKMLVIPLLSLKQKLFSFIQANHGGIKVHEIPEKYLADGELKVKDDDSDDEEDMISSTAVARAKEVCSFYYCCISLVFLKERM